MLEKVVIPVVCMVINGCGLTVMRRDFSSIGRDCRVSIMDAASPVDDATLREMDEELTWADTPYGRRMSAQECCAPVGRFVGWGLVSDEMVAPLCLIGHGKDRMYRLTERRHRFDGADIVLPVIRY